MTGKGGWYKQKTFDGDFEALGYPEFTFKGVDVTSLLYGELEALMDMRDKAAADENAGGLIEEMLHALILDWNLTDPKTGDDLPPPPVDSGSFRRLPMDFINHMITEVMKVAGEEPVPPEKGS